MLLGLLILFVALVDEFMRALHGRDPVYVAREAQEALPSAMAE
jgi:hypothetical protein